MSAWSRIGGGAGTPSWTTRVNARASSLPPTEKVAWYAPGVVAGTVTAWLSLPASATSRSRIFLPFSVARNVPFSSTFPWLTTVNVIVPAETGTVGDAWIVTPRFSPMVTCTVPLACEPRLGHGQGHGVHGQRRRVVRDLDGDREGCGDAGREVRRGRRHQEGIAVLRRDLDLRLPADRDSSPRRPASRTPLAAPAGPAAR